MAEVPFRPVRQLSEYKGKGASASREVFIGVFNYGFALRLVPAAACVALLRFIKQ